MTLHRLAVRTKKSLSGLYSSQKENTQAPSSSRQGDTTAKLTITPPKTVCSTVDESGLLRNDDNTSPGRDSPSRRQRLLGSLRSMKSLRSLRSAHSHPKKSEDEPAKTDTPSTPIRETPLVSLNFEASPADEPMFGPMTRTTSGSSSLQVHHSSPITVPIASRNTTPMNQGTSTVLATLPDGTIPDSPAPLQRASVQEAIISNAVKGSPCPASSDLDVEVEPLPTPMPGTNLPLEDVPAPGIMVTSPSAPSMQGNNIPGYFDGVIILDEKGYERTKTLDTESGFPTHGDANVDTMKVAIAELEGATSPFCATVPEVEPASFDEGFPVAPKNNPTTASAYKAPSSSNDYGEDLAYIVWDDSGHSSVEQKRKQHASYCSHMSDPGKTNPLYDGTGYGSRDGSSISQNWTDNTEAATTDATELTEYINLGEEAAETKLMAAIKELDAATLSANSPSPVDDKKALQDIIRAYAHLREGTDDATGGISLAEGDQGITPEMKDEVETSIRVMNRSLGG